MMYYYNSFYPMGMFGFGSIFMFLFWGLVIYGIVSVFRHTKPEDKNHAIEILKQRYAKGEITKEQFESMKKDLH